MDIEATESECSSASYNLNNINFHTLSEHFINGEQKSLEVHLSHALSLESKVCSNYPQNLELALLFESSVLTFSDDIFLFELNLEQYAD